MSSSQVIGYLVPLIVLVLVGTIIFIAPDSLFSGIRQAASSVVNLANYTIGAEEVEGKSTRVSPATEKAFTDLVDTMVEMAKSPRSNCFQRYTSFPELDRESLTLSSAGASVTLTDGKIIDQELTNKLTEKIKAINYQPCVIGETEEVTENFFNAFLTQEFLFESPKNPYWAAVESISFFGEKENNKISYTLSKKTEEELNDGKIIFKADNGNICFFLTTERAGLDKRYLDEENDFSLPRLLDSGALDLCASSQEITKYNSIELRTTLDSEPRIVHHCQDILGRGDCSSICQDRTSFSLPDERGCWVLISVLGASVDSNYCAWGLAEPFSINSINIMEYNEKNYPRQQYFNSPLIESNVKIIPPTFNGDEIPKRMIEQYPWPAEKSFLCLDSSWYICDESRIDQEKEYLGITLKCTKEENNFFWIILEKEPVSGIVIK